MSQQNPQTTEELKAQLEEVARKAAKQAVLETLGALGVDPSNAAELREWHADMLWTRSARKGSSNLALAVKTTLVTSLTTGLLYALWRLINSLPGQH